MGRCIKMKEVYVVVVEQETVVCVMDSAEKAEKVVDKIKLQYQPVYKTFNVSLKPDDTKLLVVYQELMDDYGSNERIFVGVVGNESDVKTASPYSDSFVGYDEYTLNDVSQLNNGEYLKTPSKRDPFVDSEYIAYIQNMRKKYQL
jgi:hypothetical protein